MPATTETRRITINVDAGQSTNQLKAIADAISGTNKNTKELADTFNLFKAIGTTFLGGLGLRQLTQFVDQIQTLNNHLLALNGDQDTATTRMKQLQQAAAETNSSLQDTADLYTRMSIALKDANIDSGVMIDFTKTLVNTFRLSGSSAEEAAAKVTSLAYALQNGGLRGRELRTILREDTELGNLLKKAFGGNLMEAANNGFITTAKFMKIIHDNMGDVNDRAKVFTATFGQSITKVMDAFKIQLFQVSQALNGPGGFAEAMDFVVQHMGQFTAAAAIISITALPALISGISKLTSSLALVNPYTAIVAIEAFVLFFASGARDASEFFTLIKVGFASLEESIDNTIAKMYELAASIAIIQSVKDGLIKQAAAYRQLAVDHNVHARALLIESEAQHALAEQQGKTAASADAWKKSIEGASKIKFDESAFQMLARLNAEFVSGAISIAEYNDKIQSVNLEKVRKEFRTGHADVEKLHEAFDKFDVYTFNTKLRDGTITFQQYDEAIRKIDLNKLNRELASGAISLEQYNQKLAAVSENYSTRGAFRTGLQDYLTSIGTTTQQVAGLITNAFHGVEDAFIEFTKNGKFNFDKFAQGVLDDLERIIIRATIIAPLAKTILSGISYSSSGADGAGSSYNDYSNVAAKGAYFDGNVAKFASGGIFSTPTMFGYGGGKTGVLGEAGPEAIIPLARGSGGELGVKASVSPVTINIINQNGSQVDQSESTGPNGDKQIDIMITSKVREGIGSGKYDKVFKSSFGMSRKGS